MAVLKDLTVLGTARIIQDIWAATFHGDVDGNVNRFGGQDADFYYGEFIMGTNFEPSNDWTGVSKLPTASAMKSGYRFSYWKPFSYVNGSNQTLTLTFQDGTTKTIDLYWSASSRITSHFGAGRYFDFIYLENAQVGASHYTGAWMTQGYYSDTTYQISSNYEVNFIHDTSTPLYRYKLIGYDKKGKIVPLVITDQTSGTIVDKTPVTVPLNVTRGISYYGTTTNITGNSLGFRSIYNELSMSNCQYTFNDSTVAYSDVYLVGTYNPVDDTFTLDTTTHKSWYCFAPKYPATESYTKNFTTGKYYWFVGPGYSSANYIQLKVINPVYYYDGTNLINIRVPGVAPVAHNIIPYNSQFNIGDPLHVWNNIYSKNLFVTNNISSNYGDFTVGTFDNIKVSQSADFTGASVTGLPGLVTAGEWYNIKPVKIKGNTPQFSMIIENYHVGLRDSSKYAMLLMRWRRDTKKPTNSWHVPFFTKFIQINHEGVWQGNIEPVDQYSNIWICDTAWGISGKETLMFGDSLHGWEDFIPMGVTMKSHTSTYYWKNTHNKRMKFGCAIFKKTGKGHWGWERVSNIAEIEFYLVTFYPSTQLPEYYINIRH